MKQSNVDFDDIRPQGHEGQAREAVVGFELDEVQLPEGYYRSKFFLGSFLAIGLSLWAGTAAL